jgi:O-6-methylguanine DNA methyltransferase
MSSSTGSGSDRRLEVVSFVTPWGDGRLALLGDLPFELELPDGAAGRIRAGEGQVPVAGNGAGETSSTRAARSWVALLERYFAGEPVGFDLDVERFCAEHGCTGFETVVYRALAAVPYGRAVSYRDLAVAASRPLAWRAVGSAMALNPLPIVLPCHRVVRSDGTLGHYGTDPAWKARLLRHEGIDVLDDTGVPSPSARLAVHGEAAS